MEGNVNDKLYKVPLEQQTRDWNQKVAQANKVSGFMDINFPSTTATEEQLAEQARQQNIEEPFLEWKGRHI